MMRRAAAVVSLLCSAAFAQDGAVGGPSLGLLYDPAAHTLHSVNGVAAAALLSDRLATADGLAWVEAAPGGAFALGVSQETGQVRILTAAGSRMLDSLPAGARGVRFSPAGRAALLLFEDRALVLTALLDSPAAAWELPAPAGALLAVSDDGARALSLLDGHLTQLSADGSAVEIPAAGARAVSFVEGSRDSLILAADPGQVLIYHDGELVSLPLPQAMAAPIASPQALPAPIAVAGTSAFVLIIAEDGTASKLARDGSTVETVSCGCKPTTLTRVGRSLLYRLNEAGDGPVWLLDAAEGPPRILFIPPAVKEAE